MAQTRAFFNIPAAGGGRQDSDYRWLRRSRPYDTVGQFLAVMQCS